MRHLSLAQVLKVHRDQGRPYFSVAPKGGEFDVAAYDVRTGKRLWREVKHNLVTRWLSEWSMYWGQISTSIPVFISPDTDQPNVNKNQYRATYQGGWANSSSFVIDSVSKLWTITGTVLAPAAGKTRTFQTVGVDWGNYTADGNSAANTNVIAATRLSSPRTQDETQQIVISYRLAWEDARDV
jgi:hypothetical protein